MAEFLIYNKRHWMDDLTPTQIEGFRLKYNNQNKEWLDKYNARYQHGDIIEVRPDGFWTGPTARGFNKEAFQVVSVPGLAMDKKYEEPVVQMVLTNPIIYDLNGDLIIVQKIVKRRKFFFIPVDQDDVVVIQKSKFKPIDKST